MSLSLKLLRLLGLAVAVCLTVAAARPPYPSPEDQIHDRLSRAREQAGYPALERREELDALARSRAEDIAARPARQRLGGATPVETSLKEGGGRYRRALERLILLRNMDQVSGVMDKWRGQRDAWESATTGELDAVGYGTARAGDGWIVFIAIMVRDLVVHDSIADIAAMERSVLSEINRIRADRGLTELLPRDDLAGVARRHSRDMADRAFFSHSNPDGTRPAGRVRAAGLKFRGVAENITMNNNPDRPAAQAVEDWMGSPGHRNNILNGEFSITGIGLAVSEDGRYYFTQLFLAP